MTISDQEKQTLLHLLQSPDWKVVEQIIVLSCQSIQERSKVADNEWETLRNTIGDEYQVRALKQLVQDIYNLAKHA